MTEKLDPHEVGAVELTPSQEWVLHPDLFAWIASARIRSIISELEDLANYLPTLPEKSDADEALRSLRHLRKQLDFTPKVS